MCKKFLACILVAILGTFSISYNGFSNQKEENFDKKNEKSTIVLISKNDLKPDNFNCKKFISLATPDRKSVV